MNIKRNHIIILIVVGMLVIGGGAAYYYLVIQKLTTTNLNQSINDTINQNVTIQHWKTYENTKYQYQIKYPADWTIEVDGMVAFGDQVDRPEVGQVIMFYGSKTEPSGQVVGSRTLWEISVFITSNVNPLKLSLRDWLKAQPHDGFGGDEPREDLENIIFKGLQALKRKGKFDEGYSIYIAKDAYVYNVSFSFEKFEGEFDVPPEQIFQGMLDTLTFTEAETENIYQNERYGFSLQYPSNLSLIEKDNEINFFDAKNSSLPPAFAIETFESPFAKNNNQSEVEFLKKVAEGKLGKEAITKVIGREEGLEVEADTLFHRHFFIFGISDVDIDVTDGYIIEIMEGRDGYFASEGFKRILNTLTFPIF